MTNANNPLPALFDDEDARESVKLAFETTSVTVGLDRLVPLKVLRPGTRESKKYAQILGSVRAIGLVEAPVVAPDPQNPDRYFLLDGHVRIEVLRDLGIDTVECLIAKDDETYTYNKRVNRLAAIQEHRMVVKAVERGVPEAKIAEALGLDISTIRRRFKLLDGICPEVVEMLKDVACPMKVFDELRRMNTLRQIEAADLMIGQNNFTVPFAKALLAATPDTQLVKQPKKRGEAAGSVSSEQITRMERELAALQAQVKSVEENYGLDNLHLTVSRGYIAKLLGNARVVRWLSQHRQEYLGEFQRVAEIETIAPVPPAAPGQE